MSISLAIFMNSLSAGAAALQPGAVVIDSDMEGIDKETKELVKLARKKPKKN